MLSIYEQDLESIDFDLDKLPIITVDASSREQVYAEIARRISQLRADTKYKVNTLRPFSYEYISKGEYTHTFDEAVSREEAISNKNCNKIIKIINDKNLFKETKLNRYNTKLSVNTVNKPIEIDIKSALENKKPFLPNIIYRAKYCNTSNKKIMSTYFMYDDEVTAPNEEELFNKLKNIKNIASLVITREFENRQLFGREKHSLQIDPKFYEITYDVEVKNKINGKDSKKSTIILVNT